MTPTEPRPTLLALFFASELRAWRGQMPLGIVFWGYGVTASSALAILHWTAMDGDQVILQQILIALSAAYTVWILMAIWRCAPNSAPLWCMLARYLTVAWALNATFILFFLQIDLVLRYARG